MEPLVAAGQALLRPAAGALRADLAAVLRNGRVVVADVLPGSQDGQLLLAIAHQRVPAKTALDLQPGTSHLLRVVGEGETLAFELLSSRPGAVADLLAALRERAGEPRSLGELLVEARGLLRAGPLDEPLARVLGALERATFPGGGDAARLRLALLSGGLGYEAALAAAERGDGVAATLEDDLKARVALALARREPGPLQAGLAALLAGIEREQLLDLARLAGGEPFAFTLPLGLGPGIVAVRLHLAPREERTAGARPGGRAAVALELPRLGRLRADLIVRPERQTVRLLVERPATLRSLDAHRRELVERLAAGGRQTRLFLRAARPAELELEAHPFDVAWLATHPMLDRVA